MRFAKIVLFTAIAGAPAFAQTQYYGAVDLGSKGSKAELFSFHRETCPTEFKSKEADESFCFVYGKTINTQLVSSMKDGQFTEVGIRDATDAVKREMDEMQAAAKKNQLQKVNYFVVGSSGVAKAKNKDALVASIKETLKDIPAVTMEFIDAKREGYYGLMWAVTSKELQAESLFVDIGSGNTKLGCLVDGSDLGSYRSAEIEYGSVTGRKKGEENNPADIKAGIQQLMREEVGPAYNEASKGSPCLRNRETIYWVGGAAWATATFSHPEKVRKGSVRITRQDVETFLARLSDGSWNQRPFQYSFPKDASLDTQKDIRNAGEKDRRSVMDTFTREDLLSGVSIMKTVLDLCNHSAVVWFVRDSNFLFGYTKEKYPEEKAAEGAPKKVAN